MALTTKTNEEAKSASGARPQPKAQPRGDGRTPVRGRPSAQAKDYEGTPLSMTGIRNGLLHSTFTKIVLGLLILIFAGTFLLGGLTPAGQTPGEAGAGGSGPDPIAQVAGQDITRARFDQALQSQMRFAEMFGQKPGPVELLNIRQQALQGLSEQAAQYKAAQDAGITVSGADIDAKIEKQIDEEIKRDQGENPADFRRRVEAQYGTEAALRDELRKNYDRDAVERALMIEKLGEKVKAENAVSEDDYKRSLTKLNLRQIVVRPTLPPPTEKNPAAARAKNEAEAKTRAEKLAAQLKAMQGAALSSGFAALAAKESADVVTKAKGGQLGLKLASELPLGTAIKEALGAAKTNLVGPLQDEFSKDFYLFLIEGRKLDLPKDYAKKKAQLLKDFETQRDNEVWSKRQDEIRKTAQTEIYDPALQAYKIQTEQASAATGEEQTRLRREALQKYQEALGYAGPAQATAIHYQMARLYRDLKQPNEYLASLKAATKEGDNLTPVRLELATALREAKQPQEAVAQLQQVSKQLTDEPPAQNNMFGGAGSGMGGGNPALTMRFQIASEFDALGRKDLAAMERQKISASIPRPMTGSGAVPGMPGVTAMPGMNSPLQSMPVPAPVPAPRKAPAGKPTSGQATR